MHRSLFVCYTLFVALVIGLMVFRHLCKRLETSNREAEAQISALEGARS